MAYWADEEKEALKAYVAQGLTGKHIAKLMEEQFGRSYTRSAIGGACSRLGHPLKGQSGRKIQKAKALVTVPLPAPIVPTIIMKPCRIWELKRGRCHFPLWPDQCKAHPDYLYCGAHTTQHPYCDAHAQVTYRMDRGEWQRRRVGMISSGMIR